MCDCVEGCVLVYYGNLLNLDIQHLTTNDCIDNTFVYLKWCQHRVSYSKTKISTNKIIKYRLLLLLHFGVSPDDKPDVDIFAQYNTKLIMIMMMI